MNTWSNRGTDTRLFHITHLDNLPAILNEGGLLSDKIMQDRPGAQVIGHGHMKARRLFEYRVACTENRFVGEFVPFYYCPRPPMLYSINRGQTGLKPGCQGDIVHLVTSIGHALAQGRPWAISDRNAASAAADFFSDLGKLADLDWQAINAKYWGDCSAAKAAEFLVADRFDWTGIQAIGCQNEPTLQALHGMLAACSHQPQLLLRPAWYYPS